MKGTGTRRMEGWGHRQMTGTWPVAWLTCMDTAVALELAGLGKGLLARVTLEHSRLLRTERGARLVSLHVLLWTGRWVTRAQPGMGNQPCTPHHARAFPGLTLCKGGWEGSC